MFKNKNITGLVSIGIPAYKATYLYETIESALSQDYKNIELIIVDDCSPYHLENIVNKFKDSRIRYYKNKENLGKVSIVHNWNKCLSFANGEFFVLLCDDDILLPNFVSGLLNLAYKYPFCNVFHARKINMQKDFSKTGSPIWPEYEDAESFLRNRLAKKRHHTITEFLYRTAAIQEKKYVVFPRGFYSDNASIISFSQNGGIASSKNCLAIFRYSEEHITTNYSPENCIGKTKDAIAYWKWIHQFEIAKEYERQINEEVQCTIFHCYKRASFKTKIRIITSTLFNIISMKTWLIYIFASRYSLK